MVWSKAKGCYVVVSELAKQNGKNKYGQTGETTGLLSALLCALMLTGSALFWPMEVSAGTQYGDDSWADGYNTAIGIDDRPFECASLCTNAYGKCFVLADGSFGRHTVWRR